MRKKNPYPLPAQLILLGICIVLAITTATGRELSPPDSAVMKVASFNIRYDAKADAVSGNSWAARKEPVGAVIRKHGFEIIGTQEGNTEQIEDLLEILPGYAVTAYPYGGKQGDAHNGAIFYKKDRFELLDQGVFWLSQTPDTPSIGWDASDRRICHWAKFRDQVSGKQFYFFNTHFYWRQEEARKQSGPLIVEKINAIAGTQPVICVGDFNSTNKTSQIQAMKTLLRDAYEATESPRKGEEHTNLGGGNFSGSPKNRIDYIFVSKNIQVKDYEVYSDRYDTSRYPSDHLPVASRIVW